MIVGWQLAGHMRTTLVLDALRMALGLRAPGAEFRLVAHTDAGSQYTSEDYTQQLDDAHVLASVGSVGDAYDNALAESFVDSFKTELIANRVWRTHTQLELAVVEYVAWFKHRPPALLAGQHPARRARAAPRRDGRRLTLDALLALNRPGRRERGARVYDPSGVVSDLR
jgi:putative transposase